MEYLSVRITIIMYSNRFLKVTGSILNISLIRQMFSSESVTLLSPFMARVMSLPHLSGPSSACPVHKLTDSVLLEYTANSENNIIVVCTTEQ